tara:strand:+ start:727 stop:972 length:246 start_codon:yes stop_codon:yes gene_type:complete
MGGCCKNNNSGKTNQDKWRYTLMTTVLFLIIVNPATYKITNGIFGKLIGQLANPSSGCPTSKGIMVHAVVFTLLLRAMMGI